MLVLLGMTTMRIRAVAVRICMIVVFVAVIMGFFGTVLVRNFVSVMIQRRVVVLMGTVMVGILGEVVHVRSPM